MLPTSRNLNQQHHETMSTPAGTTPCNIIFLDIDGVMLPFSSILPTGSGAAEEDDDEQLTEEQRSRESGGTTEDDDCLFPPGPLNALLYLLEQLNRTPSLSSQSSLNGTVAGAVVPTYVVLSSTWRVQSNYIAMIEHSFHNHAASMQKQQTQSSSSSLNPFHEFKFFDITDPKLHSERQHEIYDWLERHQPPASQSPARHNDKHINNSTRNSRYSRHSNCYSKSKLDIQAWIALDDEELMEGTANDRHRTVFEGHVIKVRSHVGLTMENAQHALALLQA